MTTKPRAKKFRIRRSVHSPATPKTPETPEDATPQARAPAIQPGAEAEIAQIRKEGLTGRQLRMARRIAQKHGLAPISDFDAVRLLRKKGIDPFQKLNMLELVVTEPARTSGDSVNLPQTVPAEAAPNLPSTDIVGSGKMADQVLQMQQDIARRRRRRSMLTLARLLVFVGQFFEGGVDIKPEVIRQRREHVVVEQVAAIPTANGAL